MLNKASDAVVAKKGVATPGVFFQTHIPTAFEVNLH
jgi:hypothetical protein